MTIPDSSPLLTDRLLAEASDGLDRVTAELIDLYNQWVRIGADGRTVDWLARLIAELGWWSGRLAGGVSNAERPFIDTSC